MTTNNSGFGSEPGFFKTPLKTLNSVNDSVTENRSKYLEAQAVENIAARICSKLGDNDHQWFPFYCKVAYNLPEYKIWNHCEKVLTDKSVKNPMKLFYWLCKKDGV